ncbi:hypothetical protein pb186bvf_006983 [Paramecium bursaria]
MQLNKSVQTIDIIPDSAYLEQLERNFKLPQIRSQVNSPRNSKRLSLGMEAPKIIIDNFDKQPLTEREHRRLVPYRKNFYKIQITERQQYKPQIQSIAPIRDRNFFIVQYRKLEQQLERDSRRFKINIQKRQRSDFHYEIQRKFQVKGKQYQSRENSP